MEGDDETTSPLHGGRTSINTVWMYDFLELDLVHPLVDQRDRPLRQCCCIERHKPLIVALGWGNWRVISDQSPANYPPSDCDSLLFMAWGLGCPHAAISMVP